MVYHVKHIKAVNGADLAAAMEADINAIVSAGGTYVDHSTNSSSTYEAYIVYTTAS